MEDQALNFLSAVWFLVFLLWRILGLSAKRTVRLESNTASRNVLFIVMLSWILLLVRGVGGAFFSRIVPNTQPVVAIGVVMALAGFALTFWARFTIGRNWSALVALKEQHEFVRSGPYAIVRHPIYSGFILAALGTALVSGELHAFIAVALLAVAWGYKARLEEQFMSSQFGETYKEYCRNVKGLIPFVY